MDSLISSNALFFGPNSSIIFSKLVQKFSSVRSNPGSISDLRNMSSSLETDNEPFLVYLSVTFVSIIDIKLKHSLTNINGPLEEI